MIEIKQDVTSDFIQRDMVRRHSLLDTHLEKIYIVQICIVQTGFVQTGLKPVSTFDMDSCCFKKERPLSGKIVSLTILFLLLLSLFSIQGSAVQPCSQTRDFYGSVLSEDMGQQEPCLVKTVKIVQKLPYHSAKNEDYFVFQLSHQREILTNTADCVPSRHLMMLRSVVLLF